jgi:ribonuclease HII
MLSVERDFAANGILTVAGVDEVGRGALAGPVTAAAVVLSHDVLIDGVADSKRLSPDRRVALDVEIRARAAAVGVAHVEPETIDAVGIVRATVLAMRGALDSLGVEIDHALADGLPVELGIPCTAIVRGDNTVRAIAAASIVAKVARDALMRELDAVHPEYGFATHKGYASRDHLDAINRLGPCVVHRRSFSPCSQLPLF